MHAFYYIEMLENSKHEENYDLDDDNEGSVSFKMDKLNSGVNKVKSLASLELLKSEGAIYQQPQTTPLDPLSRPPLAMSSTKRSIKRTPISPLKKSIPRKKKKDSYSIEDGRMFQMTEAKNGRMPMMKEMQYMKVREFSGRGLLVFPNGKKFEGEWVDGQLIGKAKITHTNGDIYNGDTYSFQRHGRGTLLFASGQKYVGEFSSGDFHGEGTLFDKNGSVIYEGEWRRGKKFDK